ncbi:MAG: FAD-dependent oxidoreductase, partial [Hyphomonas sp.]|nr:FAD-dependent oxidoreductase [Hyphomonas sp.]
QDRLFKNPKVEVVWNHVLEEVVGDENPPGVTGAKIRDVDSGEVKLVPVHGVFIAIGHAPSTELFKGKLAMKPNGYLITKPGTPQTEIPGVFAAGDVTDETYRQAVTAAGMGCMAALDAERFLAEQEAEAESVAAE